MEGLIITFFVLLWTISSGNFVFRVLVWILTHQCILLAFVVKHQCVVYIAWSGINSERDNMTSITTYRNNKALKPPFFFLSVMRVSRKLEYDDYRV